MIRRTDVILSAASAAAAIHALADLAPAQTIFSVERQTAEVDPRVTDMLHRSQVKMQIRQNIAAIAGGVRLNGVLLSEAYADIAQADSTGATQTFYKDDIRGCYLNCHGACHGSRSWR